jgi:hypothetical protein
VFAGCRGGSSRRIRRPADARVAGPTTDPSEGAAADAEKQPGTAYSSDSGPIRHPTIRTRKAPDLLPPSSRTA